MADEEPTESFSPSPIEVARRAIVLSVVSCRGIIDGQADAMDLAASSYKWLQTLDLEKELSGWERKVITQPFGGLTERDKVNASWLSEAMTVMAWALGRAELPGFDEQCDPRSIADGLGFLQPAASTALENPRLRSMAELEEYNNFIFNVHWRLRDFQLDRRPYDFESLEPILRYGLKLQEKDLPVGGVPITRAEEGERRTLHSITQERHRASNWLVGYGTNDFYEVTTDT